MIRAALAAAAMLLAPVSAWSAPEDVIDVSASRISSFRLGSSQTRFGALEFVGGLSLSASAADFGSFSGFRFLEPGSAFLGVTDTGFWYSGRIERDAAGLPTGVSRFRIAPILDREGKPLDGKWSSDAEGLSISGDRVTASFEREHRITEYRLGRDGPGPARRDLDYVVPRAELRMNSGFETIAQAPADGQLDGARIAVTERSIDANGDIFAAVLEGPRKGVFKIARIGEFDVTDGAFLPDGDLVLLERSFSMLRGVAMRMRRIPVQTIRPGAHVDGPVLIEADMSYQIDNMEGLDIWTRADGATMVSIVSDDNQSFLQRTLYLEFRLVAE